MSRSRVRSKIKTTRRVRRELSHMTRVKHSNATKVGLPSGSGAYPDGTLVASVGFWHEFGTTRMPERSWMRTSVRENRPKYQRLNRQSLKAIQQNKMTVLAAITRLGQVARDDMIAKIEEINSPPLAPSTIARKQAKNTSAGSTKVLEDTGLMKQSVTYEVL